MDYDLLENEIMNCLSLAAVINYQRFGWLKKPAFTSHSSGGWEVPEQGASRSGVW